MPPHTLRALTWCKGHRAANRLVQEDKSNHKTDWMRSRLGGYVRPPPSIFIYVPFVSLLFSQGKAIAQWARQPFPTSEYLSKVRFVDPDTGWVLSSHIYRTTDGGLTWTAQDSSNGVRSAFAALSPSVAFYTNAYNGTGIRRTCALATRARPRNRRRCPRPPQLRIPRPRSVISLGFNASRAPRWCRMSS